MDGTNIIVVKESSVASTINTVDESLTNSLKKDFSISELISSENVVVLGRSTCPYSIEAIRLLKEVNSVNGFMAPKIVQHDVHPSGAALLKAARAQIAYKTVPMIWIGREFIGGASDVAELQRKGLLEGLIGGGELKSTGKLAQKDKAIVVDEAAELIPEFSGKRVHVQHGIMMHDVVTNDWAVRTGAFLVLIVCVIGIVYRSERIMHYAVVGLAVDCFLRVCYGSTFSPIGLTAQVLVAPIKPKWTSGFGTQFAASVATMFAVTSAALFLNGYEQQSFWLVWLVQLLSLTLTQLDKG